MAGNFKVWIFDLKIVKLLNCKPSLLVLVSRCVVLVLAVWSCLRQRWKPKLRRSEWLRELVTYSEYSSACTVFLNHNCTDDKHLRQVLTGCSVAWWNPPRCPMTRCLFAHRASSSPESARSALPHLCNIIITSITLLYVKWHHSCCCCC